MNDETHFLIIALFVALFTLWAIYRLISIRYKPSVDKQKEKIVQFTAPHMEKSFDIDVVNNPIFSDIEVNVCHDDHGK